MNWAWFVFVVLLFVWWCTPPDHRPTPPVPPVRALQALNLVVQGLGLLDLIKEANPEERYVKFPPDEKSLVPIRSTDKFYPDEFANKNNIDPNNYTSVSEFDNRAKKIVDSCTKMVISSGESIYIAMLKKRVACLKNNGYDQNDILYMSAKLKRKN